MSLITTQPGALTIQRANTPQVPTTNLSGSAPLEAAAPLTTSSLGDQSAVGSSPSASSRVTDAQGHTARLALGNTGAAGSEATTTVRDRARLTYNHHGDKPVNINTPEGRRALIASSPQIDNNDRTQTDETRCGGAAMFNALVADGKPAKNAAAIEGACKNLTGPNGQPFTMSDDQKTALAAMKKGTMTANQAAIMQELMIDMTKAMPTSENGVKAFDGKQITAGGMTMLASQLKERGAFANSNSVQFTMQQNPDGLSGRHWTVAQQDKSGNTTYADSWPNEFGASTVASENQAPSRLQRDGNRNPNYAGQVTLDNLDNGQTHYEMHQYQPQGNNGIHLQHTSQYQIADPATMSEIPQY